MLSFLVPAYNAADVIGETIDSALAQDIDMPFEVVVVDDASTDSTRAAAQAFADRFPSLVSVGSHEHNRGGGATRNTAARLARGDFLYVIDADNVLPARCVAAQLETMRSSGLEAASVGQLYFFEGAVGNVTGGWVLGHERGRSTLGHLLRSTVVPASHGNYLFTRRLFEESGGYEENAGAMDAWTFGLKHLLRGFDVGIAESAHYLHRVHPHGSESYWTREQRLGTNDGNALRVLQREASRLPEAVREMVMSMTPRDHVLSLIDRGALGGDVAHFRDARRSEQIERRTLATTRGALRAAAAVRSKLRNH
jgi:glycosyltransferase involved in cell wall biosynthesis